MGGILPDPPSGRRCSACGESGVYLGMGLLWALGTSSPNFVQVGSERDGWPQCLLNQEAGLRASGGSVLLWVQSGWAMRFGCQDRGLP